MKMKKMFFLIGAVSVMASGGYAGATESKEYPVHGVEAYLHLRCDENSVPREILNENPEDFASSKRNREFRANVPGLSGGHFIFLKDKSDFDFEVNSKGEISFIQKGGFFSRDRKIKIGLVDVHGGCLEHQNMIVSTQRRIQPTVLLKANARVTINSGCHSRGNWPESGRTYWRDVEEVLTLADESTGATLVFSRDANIEYRDEAECEGGKLP